MMRALRAVLLGVLALLLVLPGAVEAAWLGISNYSFTVWNSATDLSVWAESGSVTMQSSTVARLASNAAVSQPITVPVSGMHTINVLAAAAADGQAGRLRASLGGTQCMEVDVTAITNTQFQCTLASNAGTRTLELASVGANPIDLDSVTVAAPDPPTATATSLPTGTPTDLPTATATSLPTGTPTDLPTATATSLPTATPTDLPTATATILPTATPTDLPTATPTALTAVGPLNFSSIMTATTDLAQQMVNSAAPDGANYHLLLLLGGAIIGFAVLMFVKDVVA